MNKPFESMHNDYLDPDKHLQAEMPIKENLLARTDTECPSCGGNAAWYFEPVDRDDPDLDAGWHCEECDWMQEATDEDFTRQADISDRIKPLWARLHAADISPQDRKISSLADMFANAPDGDFKWDDNEAGDWHVWCCGERDCPSQWHKAAYALDMGREGGKRYVEARSVDEDGNWDFDASWDEREGQTESDWDEFARYTLDGQMDEFFKGWARYWIHCAETRTDVLSESSKSPSDADWVDFCISAAEDDIKYLEMGK